MRRMKFPEKWVGWIESCLKSARVSVLVNGSLGKKFKMGRGLRQGDPLAPLLFLIVAEGLNGLFQQAVCPGKFEGYDVGLTNPVKVSLLQFSDDRLFIGNDTLSNTLPIKSVLRCFELVSGLNINLHKSKLAGD